MTAAATLLRDVPAPEEARRVQHPPAPRTLEESGLSLDLVSQLALKHLNFSGDLMGVELASRLGLEYSVLEPALDMLKRLRQCEIVGSAMVGGPSYRYRITDAGRQRAILLLEHSAYIGAAPVPLAHYREYMQAYRDGTPDRVTRERVRAAFGHLVLPERTLHQVGPAVAAGHSLFVYGPPGNGKTVIAQGIRHLLDDEIAIPHALEVQGSIVRVFDPVCHEPLPQGPAPAALARDGGPDQRWVRCRRPSVTVGGELTLKALDLAYAPTAGFYTAPVQLVANGGVLVIDDFGRQQCAARDLLNRWIVPLESRVDFLTLRTGQKFEIPFMALVVFATNIRPAELVDEAFLRRIHYKVFAGSPSVAEFRQIFQNCCRERGIPYDQSMVDGMLTTWFRPRRIPLRGCHPRDLIDHALSQAAYHGAPRRLTPDLLEAACESYFVDDSEDAAVYA